MRGKRWRVFRTAGKPCMKVDLSTRKHSGDLSIQIEFAFTRLPGSPNLVVREIGLNEGLVLGFHCNHALSGCLRQSRIFLATRDQLLQFAVHFFNPCDREMISSGGR